MSKEAKDRRATYSDFSAENLAAEHGLCGMDELIRRMDNLKKPARMDLSEYDHEMVITNAIAQEEIDKSAERVLSAHVLPKKFPVNPDNFVYPPIRDVENPLYYSTNSTYGNEIPRPHQPITTCICGCFDIDCAPRAAGLNTKMPDAPTGGAKADRAV